MSFWTAANLAAVTQGQWLSAPPDPDLPVQGVGTDSRAPLAGRAFLALRGEKFDAHDYLPQAAAAQPALLVVQDPLKARAFLQANPASPPLLLVTDTLDALTRLAHAFRGHLAAGGCKVIAVGGSNGKTTTRTLIHTALASSLKGSQSPKSFNNHIGVPLTLLAANPSDHFVVVEIGTNHPGEIDRLAAIVRPDAAVITSIGHEHMEFFKTLDGVAAEEAQLLRHLRPSGVAFIQAQALPLLRPHLRLDPSVQTLLFGDADDPGVQLAAGPSSPHADGLGQDFPVVDGPALRLPLPGRHMALNALAALAVARWMGLTDSAVARALANAAAAPMRLEVNLLGSPDSPDTRLALINDAYNANPDSMAQAVTVLARYPTPSPAGRRIAVLGDMRELGDDGPDLHRRIAQIIAALGPPLPDPARAKPRTPNAKPPVGLHQVVFIGRLSMFAADTLARSWPADRVLAFAAWDDQTPAKVAALLRPGDAVLIKASRGMGLERLVPAIRQVVPDARPKPQP